LTLARRTALEQEQEAARQARLRQEQIAALVAEARASRSHADAVAALTRALELDPSDQKVRALLETRTAAAERERAEAARQQSIQGARTRINALIEKRKFDSAQAELDDAARTLKAKRELKDVSRALARERRAAAGPQPVFSRTQLGIAAAVMLLVGLGYWALRTPGPASTTSEPSAATQTSPTTAPGPGPEIARPDPNVPVPPDAGNSPRADSPVAETPVAEPPAIGSVVAETIQRARQQMTQGNLPRAAGIVMEGLKSQPSDGQLRALAVEIVTQARAQASKARGAADLRGDAAVNSPAYRDAGRQIVNAARHERAGRYEQATRSLTEAEGLFARASQVVPAPPPQVAQPPRPTSPTEDAPAKPSPTAAAPAVTEAPSRLPPAAAPPPAATAPPTAPAPQPTPTAPATSTPSPAASAARDDEEGIRSALRAYEQAYSSLKVEAVVEVYPDINAAQLKRSFDDLREQQVSLACDQIAVSGVNANVTCQVRTSVLPRAGSRQTSVIRSLFRLQKVGNRWIIVERRGS
jgi:tetratricopeptide (TPR) repeat protein